MRGLILAGALDSDGSAAAVRRVAGLSLLERALLVARDAGVLTAVVLADRRLHAALREALRRLDIGVDLHWWDPVEDAAAIAQFLGGADAGTASDVVVVRADVALGRAASPLVREARGDGARGAVLVDRDPRTVRGARRMQLGAGGPAWIGIAIVSARAAREVADGMRRAPDRGDRDALAAEIEAGGAVALGAGSVPWQVVRDEGDARGARRRLFRSLGKPQDGVVSRYVNRPISTTLSRVLVALPLHPNVLTVFFFLLSLTGCALVAFGDRYWYPLFGTALVNLASILDGCDGEVARLRHQMSHTGAWLDTIGDEATTLLYAAAAGIAVWRLDQSYVLAVLSVLTLICGGVAMAVTYAYIISIGSGNSQDFPSGVARASAAKGWWGKTIGFFAYLPKRDTMNFVMLLDAALGILELNVVLIFMGASIMCAVFLRQHFRIRRNETGLAPPRGGPRASRAPSPHAASG